MATTETERYTLDEAVKKIARLRCSLEGHDLEIIEQVGKGPVAITCTRCGKHWRAEPE